MDTENLKEELLERIAEARGAAIRARGDELDEATKEIEELEPMLFHEALLGSDDQGRQSVKGYGAAGAAKRGVAGPRLLRGYS